MKNVSMYKKKCKPQGGREEGSPSISDELRFSEARRGVGWPRSAYTTVDTLEERTARTSLMEARMRLVAAIISGIICALPAFGFTSPGDVKTGREAPRVVVNNYYYNMVQSNVFTAHAKEEFKK
ncbi:hypothetical protein ABZT06_45735 [Streptomyces sp. NPDC005483]|uniref:hypothetical protein n=1 Tax=Streptomyces sp. NPDC005483 TaxID=3154882 RepID=UPI0033BE26B7